MASLAAKTDAVPAQDAPAAAAAAADANGGGAQLTKAQKKRAAKKRAAERKAAGGEVATTNAEGVRRGDPAAMAAMLEAAKARMRTVNEGQTGEDQIRTAMQALNLVTGALREQTGSEEGVLDVLKEARARAEAERAAKERDANRQLLREKVKARASRS